MADGSDLELRALAHRMSCGLEVKTRKFSLLRFRNVFLGKDAVTWLIADPKSGVEDVDAAMQLGQRMIDNGYMFRVSRKLNAQERNNFGRAEKTKKQFRGGDAIYRFDTLRISPFLLHVVVRRARNLKSHDLNGKNDPYVKLRLGSQRAVTRVQLCTNDPVWNEHFLFGVTSVEAQQLHLTVCDYDKFKSDDLIGSCSVGLSHLPCEDAADTDTEGGDAQGGSITSAVASMRRAAYARGGGGGGAGGADAGDADKANRRRIMDDIIAGGSLHATYAGRDDERRGTTANIVGNDLLLSHDDDEGRNGRGDGDGGREYLAISPLASPTGSSISAVSAVTLPTKFSGNSDYSDIDSDDWDSASRPGEMLKKKRPNGGASSVRRSLFRGQRAKQPQQGGAGAGAGSGKTSSGMMGKFSWSKKKSTSTNSSSSSQQAAGEPLRESDSADDDDGRGESMNREARIDEGQTNDGVYKEKHTKPKLGSKVGRGVVLKKGASSDDSLAPAHGSTEALSFYQLIGKESSCSFVRGSMEETKAAQPGSSAISEHGELACDIWLTSFQPKPLPVQGEAKFSLRCRLCHVAGVTSSEVRTLGEIGTSIRHKVSLTLNGERVSSASNERGKDKKTGFGGALMSLDTRANMATDMLKVVVHHRVAPVELVYKPAATVLIPLRSIAVQFPCSSTDEEKNRKNANAKTGGGALGKGTKSSDALEYSGGSTSSASGGEKGKGKGKVKGRGGVGAAGNCEKDADDCCHDSPWQALGEPERRQYHLQTLAGPLTSRTMDNGYISMSLVLVPSGNELLGEQDPVDSEPVAESLPDLPQPLAVPCVASSLGCGYQRLRKALLWQDSKLMAAHADMLDYSERYAAPWVQNDGSPGQQGNMSDCTRDRSFVVPKSSMAAATKAEATEVVTLDGPCAMSFESRVRTPAVPFGDKFEVVSRFVLVKEGPQKCRLSISSEAVFSEKIMALVQGQVVSAVSKVSKENYGKLLALIEDALSGGGGPGSRATAGRNRKKGSARFLGWWLPMLVVLAASGYMLALRLRAVNIPTLPAVNEFAGGFPEYDATWYRWRVDDDDDDDDDADF